MCRRSGTSTDYTYSYQQSRPFRYNAQVAVAVDARDLAGNVMPQQAYSFATEMYSFARGRKVSESQANRLQGKPAAAGDGEEGVWIAWHAGDAGNRHVYVALMSSVDGTRGDTIQVSQSAGDHCNPAVGVDDAGVIYVVWQENARGAWELSLSTSANGQSWSSPKRIAAGTDAQAGPVGNQVTPAIAAEGLTAVAWQDDRAGNQDIYVVASSDRFATTTVSRVTANTADQIDPAIAIDSEGKVVVLWTDARNGSTDIYGAASDEGPWTNRPIVNTGAGQSQPALAAGSSGRTLHMVWTEDVGGNLDICYSTSEGLPASPVTGSCVVDDTSNADQRQAAVVAAARTDEVDAVFACWQDDRNRAYGGDTDLYFADLGTGSLRTNVLVDDRGMHSDQNDVAMAVDHGGYPCIAWTDGVGGKPGVLLLGRNACRFCGPGRGGGCGGLIGRGRGGPSAERRRIWTTCRS